MTDISNDPELNALIAQTKQLMDEGKIPPEHMPGSREQMISFVWGNLNASSNHKVSREVVERVVDEHIALRSRVTQP